MQDNGHVLSTAEDALRNRLRDVIPRSPLNHCPERVQHVDFIMFQIVPRGAVVHDISM